MTLHLHTKFLIAALPLFLPVAAASAALTGGTRGALDHRSPGNSQRAETDSTAAAGKVRFTTRPRKGNGKPKGRDIDGELRCLALNIYHEARSESETGQEAVAAVTLNRVQAKSFPNSVCRVVRQGGERRNRCQFSWWCDGKSDQPTEGAAWEKALDIARESLLGVSDDPTNGALYYHAERVRPRWSRAFRRTTRIGDHIFYKPQENRS